MPDIKIKNWRNILYGAAIAMIALSAALLALAYIYTGNTLRKGIAIEEADVSWLSRAEARDLIAENISGKYPTEDITLIYGDRQWVLRLSDISYEYLVDDAVEQAYLIGRTGNIFQKVYHSLLLSFKGVQINVGVDYDRVGLRSYIKKIKNECDTTGKNAEIAYVKGVIEFKPENIGRALDIDRNTELVENHLRKREFGKIELLVDEQKPHIVYEEIKDIEGAISHFSTGFSTGDANRSDNIRLACSRIDNRILLPGEEFSMNEALGPRTLENGYKEAPVILKSELVSGTGGGVCQVSSTLYNAVLLAGLKVTDRTRHSIPLAYISPGRDATINEDSIDFRFINSLDYPICLQTDVKGGTLNIRILGKKGADDRTYKLSTETIAVYPPEPDEVVVDPSLQYGERIVERKAIEGVRVILYREAYKSDTLLWREKLTEDYYKPVRGKVRVSGFLSDVYDETQ